jgi:CubicO group peptidase (beta-lactamase class C family)
MVNIKKITISFLLLLAIGNIGFAQSRVNKIEAYLTEMEKAGFFGTVLVEVNGKKVLSKGYGSRDINQKLKNTPNTIFDIGSITKQFTAAAILKLEMQSKLSTDDKISRYFSDVPADKSEITIHHLLRHSAGLPSVVGGDYEKITQSEFVEKVMKAPLRFESGAKFSYSNVGYSLLAMIVEKVSGQSYEQFLYENLWKPSNMESTGYKRPNFDNNFMAIGYRDDKEWGKPTDKEWDKDAPYWHLAGNGGILSTTEDLYKWHTALLSEKILSKEAKEKYYHPKLRADETTDSYYAYGWDVSKTKRNTRLIWHNGANGVFYAEFFRYADEAAAIVIMTNRSNPGLREAGRAISKIIFDPSFKPVIPIAENETNRAFTAEIIKTTVEKGFAAGTEIYKKRKRGVDLIEHLVNSKGYDLLSDKKLPESIDIFKLNVLAFPRSANAFDSLGEAYLEAGNKDLAIENYKKSLLLNPDNKNAEEVLKGLVKK